VKKRPPAYIDIEIDKLTNSIENSLTGEIFDTEIARIRIKDIKQLDKKDWQFDWIKELKDNSKEVYKLSTVNNPTIIQGLLSIEDKKDHIFLHLIESTPFNKGKSKVYLGVAANMVAYACKVSFDKGYNGYVAFDAKTNLIKHYEQSLGATHFHKERMYVGMAAATKLISHYFKS
jgi:hypothetical protein